MEAAPRQGHPVRFGLFELNPSSGELLREGRRVRLQEQPFRILTLLLERRGELVTREDLRQRLWPSDTFVDFDDGLNAAVKRLRFALGDSPENPRFIETIPRRGYRFIAPVATGSKQSLPPLPVADTRSVASPRPATLASGIWVALAAVVAVLVAGVALNTSNGPSTAAPGFDPAAIRLVVVLPLKNLSNDPEQQYFADGMTEELIARLASLGGLRVISRTSAMQYKATTKLMPQIASELHVDAIIEGSVLRSGDRVRITAQLVHGPTDRHLWAESYERNQRDVLVLQNEVARDIARKVSLTLRASAVSGPHRARVVHPEAHQAYLLGRYRWHHRRGAELLSAIADFQKAISIDPDYALA